MIKTNLYDNIKTTHSGSDGHGNTKIKVIRSVPYIVSSRFPRIHIVRAASMHIYSDGSFRSLAVHTWCGQIRHVSGEHRKGRIIYTLTSRLTRKQFKDVCPYCPYDLSNFLRRCKRR